MQMQLQMQMCLVADYPSIMISLFFYLIICLFVCYMQSTLQCYIPPLFSLYLCIFIYELGSFGHRGLRYDFLREKNMDRSIDLAVQHIPALALSASLVTNKFNRP